MKQIKVKSTQYKRKGKLVTRKGYTKRHTPKQREACKKMIKIKTPTKAQREKLLDKGFAIGKVTTTGNKTQVLSYSPRKYRRKNLMSRLK